MRTIQINPQDSRVFEGEIGWVGATERDVGSLCWRLPSDGTFPLLVIFTSPAGSWRREAMVLDVPGLERAVLMRLELILPLMFFSN